MLKPLAACVLCSCFTEPGLSLPRRPYPWHSVEGQMRQLGDLAFLMRQYAFAESIYRLAAQVGRGEGPGSEGPRSEGPGSMDSNLRTRSLGVRIGGAHPPQHSI